MILLNKFLKSFSLESWYNEQIVLLHTEDRARMHKKDAQDISTQVLMVSFLTSSHKGNQNSACSMKPKTKKPDSTVCYIFLQNSERLNVHNNSCYAAKADRMTGL